VRGGRPRPDPEDMALGRGERESSRGEEEDVRVRIQNREGSSARSDLWRKEGKRRRRWRLS